MNSITSRGEISFPMFSALRDAITPRPQSQNSLRIRPTQFPKSRSGAVLKVSMTLHLTGRFLPAASPEAPPSPARWSGNFQEQWPLDRKPPGPWPSLGVLGGLGARQIWKLSPRQWSENQSSPVVRKPSPLPVATAAKNKQGQEDSRQARKERQGEMGADEWSIIGPWRAWRPWRETNLQTQSPPVVRNPLATLARCGSEIFTTLAWYGPKTPRDTGSVRFGKSSRHWPSMVRKLHATLARCGSENLHDTGPVWSENSTRHWSGMVRKPLATLTRCVPETSWNTGWRWSGNFSMPRRRREISSSFRLPPSSFATAPSPRRRDAPIKSATLGCN
jgi:hypothetical protein